MGSFEIYDANEYISKTALEETSIKLWPPKTLSVAMYGEGQTRGKVSIIMKEMATNQACCNIVVNEGKADYRYVYYWLKSNYHALRAISSGVRRNLNSDDIKNFPINLPKLSSQKQIGSVLYVIDKKIELNNKINAELEAMAKTIYEYWFLQFDFPNEEGKPYRSSGGKMVWNEQLKREIPDGWEVKPILEWIKSDKRGDWGKDSIEGNYQLEVLCIRGTDLNGLNGKGELNAPTRYILKKNAEKLLESHDLIVEISGGSPTQSTGRLGLVTEKTLERFSTPIICSNFCKAFALKEKKLLFNFVYQWNNLYECGVLFGWEGKTSGIKNLLYENFVSGYKMPFPPSELVSRFYDYAKSIHDKIQKTLIENQELVQIRDWLLPMLMNGQVTVEERAAGN